MGSSSQEAPKCCGCGCFVVFDGEGKPTNAITKNGKRVGQKGGNCVYACIECNRLSSRIYKIQVQDPSLCTVFRGMGAEEKQEFMLDHHGVSGEELVKALHRISRRSEESEQQGTFQAKGKFVDEEDLTIKYKDKPEQLRSILDNARTIQHPTRNVKLYEDVEFEAVSADSHKRKRTEELETTVREKIKKPRKEKEGTRADAEACPAQGKELPPKKRDGLTKLTQKASKVSDDMAAVLESSEDDKFAGYLAPAVVDLAKKHKAEVDVALADMTVALEPAWKGKVSPLEKRLREAIKEAQSSCDRVDGQISDAQNMIAPKT